MTVQEAGVDPSVILIAASIVGVTTIIIAFLGCMWCRNKWKKLTRRHYQFSGSPPDSTSVRPSENVTEFTLFPPPSGNQFGLPTGISPDEVVFEPLPEIRSRALGKTSENVRPARFTGSCEKISLQDWFDEYQVNFPRGNLQYVREVGPAWYGQAVEGEALGLGEEEGEKRKVVVKILRVDATSTELMQYLQETRTCRDLKHPNLLNLLNRCLEVHPFLLIMEHCDMDLKSYLIGQRKSPEALLKDGILLRMACNITAALQYMHEHGFIHMDVAAHSCLVTSEGVVKLGDYGTAVFLHKSDFYCLGDVAFPIRWCAPETLMCTESVVEAKDITREANIWSFGVVLWELLEFGKLPYVNVNDNDVIQKVLIECCLRLEQPKTPCVHKDMIYKIMLLCWMPSTLRPTVQKVSALLNYLYDNRDVQSEDFESRWNSLQPILREHNLYQRPPSNLPLRFETDFNSSDCTSNDGVSIDFDRGAHGDKSPSSGSISMGELAADISPSLLNLRGSVEDLIVGGDNSSMSNQYEDGDTAVVGTFNGQYEESTAGNVSVVRGFNGHHVDSVRRVENESLGRMTTFEQEVGTFDSQYNDSEPPSLETIPASEASDTEAIHLRISEAIRDLDTILADEAISSESSDCNTPEKRPGASDRVPPEENDKLNGGSVVLNLDNTAPLKSESDHVLVNMVDD